MHEPGEVHHSRCSVAVLLGNGDLHDIGAGDLGVDRSHVLVVAHEREQPIREETYALSNFLPTQF